MNLRAGVIGLGAMGGPMAANLAKAGVAVSGCDSAAPARDRARDAGVTLADGPAALAAACDVVFTCLPSLAAVREVYEGPGGLIAAARTGLITVECSTIDAAMAVAIADAMRAKGAAHVESLLIGRPPEARAGQLYFVVSGDAGVIARVAPLLRHMGRAWRHVGANGAANTIKVVHNALVYVHALATAEALALARARGADVAAFIDVVREGGGAAYSKYFDLHAADIAADRDGGWGRLYIAAKDTEALSREVHAAGLDLPLFAAAAADYRAAVAAGLSQHEFTAVARVLETRNGKRLFGANQTTNGRTA